MPHHICRDLRVMGSLEGLPFVLCARNDAVFVWKRLMFTWFMPLMKPLVRSVFVLNPRTAATLAAPCAYQCFWCRVAAL